jgi:CRISPR-associated protein Cmr3
MHLPAGARTSLPSELLPLWHEYSEQDYYQDLNAFIDHKTFHKYLGGEAPDAPPKFKVGEDELELPPTAHHYQRESRTSLRIEDKTQTADEGQLFTVEFTRMNRNVGFALALDHATTLGNGDGLLRLGGEARSATYEIIEMPNLDDETLREQIEESGRFTLVLTTPVVFREGGWRPDFIQEDNTGTLGGCYVKLVGAAVGRFQHLGGWDLAEGRPKTTQRAVPAGSVYFFELKKGTVADLFEDCFGASISSDEDDAKQGLGLAYLGVW